MAGGAPPAGDDFIFFYNHRLFYRITDGEDELTVFKCHFKLNDSVCFQLFAGGNCIVKEIP